MAVPTPIDQAELTLITAALIPPALPQQALSSWQSLAAVIDHTLLKPDATRAQVENLCDEAARYKFACAMVNPVWASTAVGVLSGTGVPVGASLASHSELRWSRRCARKPPPWSG